MTASFPIGRRRLVVRVAAESVRARPVEPGVVLGASDAELVRLTTEPMRVDQARRNAWAVLHGLPL